MAEGNASVSSSSRDSFPSTSNNSFSGPNTKTYSTNGDHSGPSSYGNSYKPISNSGSVHGVKRAVYDSSTPSSYYMYDNSDKISKNSMREVGSIKDCTLTVVYTDGACARNGQWGSKGGIGVYFGPNDPRNISEPLEGSRQTNQRAELMVRHPCSFHSFIFPVLFEKY